ncbi:hypothetical protein QJQ45_013238 [Haematococcus lacustris]|nr:hypothetical protein QJQ45_013238 [Haematococcus lacustris]
MGNLCVRGIASEGTVSRINSSDSSQSQPAVLDRSSPHLVWKADSTGKWQGQGTLQDICIGVAAKHFAVISRSSELDRLPRDLVQRVCDALVQGGRLTLGDLQRLAGLDLDALSLDCYGPQVDGSWLQGLARSPRLRRLDLSRCPRVGDEGLREVGSQLRGLQALLLGHCGAVTDLGLAHLAGKGGAAGPSCKLSLPLALPALTRTTAGVPCSS